MSNLFEQKKALENISLDYLYTGLVAQDDIFNHDGTLLLVAKGIALTESTLKRLRRFNSDNHNIKVTAKVRDQLMNRGLSQVQKQQNLENETGYSDLKGETESLISVSQITDTVPYDQAQDAGNSIIERIDVTDPYVIFQWIGGNVEVDEYLCRHSTNVAIINGLMGKWLGLSDAETQELVVLGLVHDIGKTKIPVDILNSPNMLAGSEAVLVRKHPVYSYEMLSSCGRFSEAVRKGALHHHEMMNGTGYPDALTADEIPFYSRITAVSEAYDEKVSERAYKSAQSPFNVLVQMQADQFSGLDIRLVKLFIEQMPRELIGKTVLLSDGTAGIVRHINDMNIEYPLVEVNGNIIATNKDLSCVSMML
jgi:HD-GYP domain-containing protein (c-di-GMP phosphodiesterase class II)